MAFLVYSRTLDAGHDVLRVTANHFSLAGYNLVWKAWKQRGQPIRKGWHVSADDLITILTDGQESYNTRRLIIDYDPRSKERIALIELLDIHLYTWDGASLSEASWTPMMLQMRDVFEEWFDRELTPDEKAIRIERVTPKTYGDPFVEFLYLQGDRKGWNWGRNGATNAVFLHAEARDYFRQYF
ncbi:MAG TPA: hypothetical protein VD738_03665 [Nitrospira sp.]|nr:hypothetical protein [Nitrospira sp.]